MRPPALPLDLGVLVEVVVLHVLALRSLREDPPAPILRAVLDADQAAGRQERRPLVTPEQI